MQKVLFLLSTIALLVWQSCSCPPDEQTGTLALGQTAQDFLPYTGNETLVFVNENGEQETFSLPRGGEFSEDKLCYRTTCTEAKYNSPSSCEYYLADSRRFTFFSTDNTTVLDLLVYSDVYDYGKADFYDAFQIGYSTSSSNVVAHHVIEPRFTGIFDIITLSLSDLMTSKSEITLNGRPLTNVLCFEEGNTAVYVQPGVGVVGYKDASHTWVLQ
ncbi:MAG: hypothetical protein R2795_21085 [Saprospiraceae bacterium]